VDSNFDFPEVLIFLKIFQCRINNSSKCSNCYDPRAFAEWDSSAPPFRRWTFLRWNVKCIFLWNHQSAKVRSVVVWEACKRKSQSSTCPRSFQLCCIYCDSWCIPWIFKLVYGNVIPMEIPWETSHEMGQA